MIWLSVLVLVWTIGFVGLILLVPAPWQVIPRVAMFVPMPWMIRYIKRRSREMRARHD